MQRNGVQVQAPSTPPGKFHQRGERCWRDGGGGQTGFCVQLLLIERMDAALQPLINQNHNGLLEADENWN